MIIVAWLVGRLLRLLFFALVALFSGMAVMSYRLSRVGYPISFDFNKSGWSVLRFIVGCGVKLLGGMIRLFKTAEELLIQASADVGEWFISGCSEKVQAEIRSRFL